MVSFNVADLEFILLQIQIAEQNATKEGATPGTVVAGTPLSELISNPLLPYGLRTVDGTFNNIIPGRETWGAADQEFARLLDPDYRDGTAPPVPFDTNGPAPGGVIGNTDYNNPGSVVDTAPRTISNLIVDQTPNNGAAIDAALFFVGIDGAAAVAARQAIETAYQPLKAADLALRADPLNVVLQAEAEAAFQTFKGVLATDYGIDISDNRTLSIPNIAPDEGISAPFNSWMTLFGQFFDHGLDLVPKGNNGTVFVPLLPDDPLYVPGGNANFMVVTRTIPDAINITTPFVDQNQTYTSHSSHQVFLREYVLDANGDAVATGKLLNGSGGTNGLPTWQDVKAQALAMLGIELTDLDVTNVPLLATDQYGRFLRGENGYAQLVVRLSDGSQVLVEGSADGLDPSALGIAGATVVRTNHAFLDDIAHNAAPVVNNLGQLVADVDTDAGNAVAVNPLTGRNTEYDDELLNAHFITGDGRGNENIGLTAVHHVFHSEHNRLVEQTKEIILGSGDPAFIAQWQFPDGSWNGERLFQAARFGTEMQYQHLVFEEFARKVQPAVDLFIFNPTMDVNPAIVAEFAHTVYRFGHSMLNETVERTNIDNSENDIGLIEAFLNPLAFHDGGTAGTLTSEEAAGAIIRGMTEQRGNEIDEFVTEALRNNLLGLPLDLATVNLARGREAGVPSLNDARRDFFAQTSSEWLRPYDNWIDFAQSLKNPASIINFVAAYGTHSTITSELTLDGKRAAATALVLGGAGAPGDRIDFLNGTGAYVDQLGGLDNVDFWIGGLAEKIHPFGGMLGSTFNFVFEVQMEKLQNGDRFYYLSRTQGMHFITELENNSFTSLIKLNTDLSDPLSSHLPGEIFSTPDYILEVDIARQRMADAVHDNPILEALQPKVDRGQVTFQGETYEKLQFAGGEHVVLGGTHTTRDMLIADDGDDTLWGEGGNDFLVGGHGINRLHGGAGDDIIFDGNDPSFIHGEEGNDVISAGGGIGELIFGHAGSDFVIAGFDAKEVFAGEGNDFVLGTPDVDFLLGNEGDDWLEGGEGFDTLAGDNSELFFNSKIIGHDVLIAGTNENDFDAESGDDIMVQGESVMRNEGMLGFDWVTFQNAAIDAYGDMRIKIFTTEEADILRNRFDRVEAMSGWARNDTLIGDDRLAPDGIPLPGVPVAEATFDGDQLNAEGALRIAGFADVLGISVATLQGMDPAAFVFAAGNILLGGGGSDLITGGGGDDIIDGDKWLSVGIRVVPDASRGQTFPPFQVGSMTAIQARVLSGEINPTQLSIVREILNGNVTGDIDTARFGDIRDNYTIVGNANGSLTVTHDIVTPGVVDPTTGRVVINEGIDTIWNVERLQFSDETLDTAIFFNQPPTGAPTINDQTPTESQVLTASAALIADPNGVGPISFRWEVSTNGGTTWTPIPGATNPTFTPQQAQVGGILRVVASFTDGGGFAESVASTATGVVGDLFNGAILANNNFVGTAGDDIANGVNSILGLTGNDTFQGNGGNDTINGNGGNDTAVFVGAVSNFNFGTGGNPLVVTDLTGVEGTDTLSSIEQLRFAGQTYAVLSGGVGNNNLNGGGGQQILFGFAGTDTLDGGGANDVLVGGAGNDTIIGGTGNDLSLWRVGDGRDVINGGVGGTDTAHVAGDGSQEAFIVYTAANAVAAGITGLNAATQIVITRNGAVINELNNIEEIVINGLGGGDTFATSGNFAPTTLSTSTITIEGSDGNDVIDISALTSEHRIVFKSKGGSDTIVGTLRPQDVIELEAGTLLADYTSSQSNGLTTLSNGTSSITFESAGTPAFAEVPADESGAGPGGGSAEFTLTASDLATLKALVNGQQPPGVGDDEVATGVRTLDGHGNNVANPAYGAADEPFIRITTPHYGPTDAFGNREINPIFDGLDARNISNILGTQEAGLAPNDQGANIFFMAFGQYVDHGLDFLGKGGNGTIAIGGPGVGATSNNPLDLTRGTVSGYDANGVPQHINKTSPYVDQNQAYGSTDLVGQFLRTGDGSGGLDATLFQGKPDPSNPLFNLLPTLGELLEHHWANDTVFVSSTLPGGSVNFRAFFDNIFDDNGNITGTPAEIKAIADNFMGSGHALLLDTNPVIDLLDHYVAGDGRANENFTLTSIHTIWARNHNFHVENLKAAGFEGTAEEVFQAAKIINEAEYQRVVFGEFADTLIGGIRGDGTHGHNEYNPDATASISHEFAAAVYRVGHSLIGQTVTVLNPDGTATAVPLFDAFLNPTNDSYTIPLPPNYQAQPGYEQLGVNAVVGGIVQQQAEEVDFNLVDAVRNDLVRLKADLFAFNVARGWDVGIGTLNQVRGDLAQSQDPYIAEARGFAGDLNPYTSWEDFQARNNLSNTVIEQFKEAYPDLVLAAEDIAAFQAINPDIVLGGANNDTVKGIDRVDLWVGGLAEKHINGGIVGQTFWVVLHEQFDRLQEADRFYYTDRLDNLDLYENLIDGQSLADIVARNTGIIGLPEDMFEAAPLGGDMNVAPVSPVNVTLTASLEDAARTITMQELLVGTTDLENDNLSILDLKLKAGSLGSLVSNGNGTWTYTPGADDDTSASFTYRVSDGKKAGGTVTATLDLLPDGDGQPSTPGGGSSTSNIVVNGSKKSDKLFGNGGDDTIKGKDGNDRLNGRDGDDKLFGEKGRDVLVGGSGDGDDIVNGGSDNDTYTVAGTAGAVTINLATGKASGAAGNDTLRSIENAIGGEGDDTLIGNSGRNTLRGGGGDDTINGGRGNDTLSGGTGGDKFVFQKGFGNDVITDFDANPDGGQDKIDLSALGISSGNFDQRVAIMDAGFDTLVVVDYTQKILLKGVGVSSQVTESDFVLFTN
ncbi:MAG: peroxidase family protein [Hyphomicrobium sp.]